MRHHHYWITPRGKCHTQYNSYHPRIDEQPAHFLRICSVPRLPHSVEAQRSHSRACFHPRSSSLELGEKSFNLILGTDGNVSEEDPRIDCDQFCNFCTWSGDWEVEEGISSDGKSGDVQQSLKMEMHGERKQSVYKCNVLHVYYNTFLNLNFQRIW